MFIKLIAYILVLFLSFTFFGCSDSSGGDESDTTTGVSLAMVKSIANGEDDEDTDIVINDKCGGVGGIAIYSGIDTNQNNELDKDERVGDAQVLCNGNNGLTGSNGSDGNSTVASFNVEEIAVNSSECPLGGIKLITPLSTLNLCNEVSSSIKDNNDSVSEVIKSLDYTKTSTINGKIELETISQAPAKASSRIKKASSNMQGGLWLTASSLKSAIAEDKKSRSESTESKIPQTVTKPIEVAVKADNSYTIPNVASGEYSLVYIDDATDEGVKIDDIYVAPNTTVTKDIVEVKPNGSVTLTVASLQLGSNIENATIRVNELDITTTSSADGTATFKNLPEGAYSITISKDGYVSKYLSFIVTSAQETNLQTLELNNLKGALVGKVKVNGIDDLSNIIVYAKGLDGSLFTTFTDFNGNYSFNALSVGKGYSVLAYAHDFESSKVDSIDITADKTTTADDININRALTTVGSITGFARFSDREDMNHAGIIVSIEGTDYEAITARDGSFILNNIPSGRYTLNILDSNYQTTTLKATKVIAGDTTTLLDIELLKVTGVVSGKVSLGNSTDNTGIKVSLIGTDLYTYTDSTGSWSMILPVGNYSGLLYSKELYELKDDRNTVTITQSGEYIAFSQEIEQIASHVIGKVMVTEENDASASIITISGTDGVSSTLNPNSDGEFELSSLPFGSYIYTISYIGSLHETLESSFEVSNENPIFNLGTLTLRKSFVKINNDATYINSKTVTLNIGNSDAQEMQISEGGTTYDRETFVSEKSFTLSDGDGEKRVTVDFFDSVGSPLSSISDTIILDTTLNTSTFKLQNATKMNDVVKISLNVGETGAEVVVDLPSLIDGLILFDNGIAGDTTANDGIYERDYLIKTPNELDIKATATITDKAGNSITAESDNNLILSTPPSILNLQVNSNVADATMSITFTTDEPTTSIVSYGADSSNLDTELTINSSLASNHTITLLDLSVNEITYFELEVKDSALNLSTLNAHGKLAPPPPTTLNVEVGDSEVGMVWSKVTTDGVIGYNVYRSSDGEAYIKANSSLVKENYFLDDIVSNDTTYSYQVTAVDDNANESEKSVTATAKPLASLAGPTEIAGGVIDKDSIWLSSRSPYNITADMKVKEGSTLIWLAGTTVNLSGDERELLVDGNLYAYGSDDNNVFLNAINFTEQIDDGMYDEKKGNSIKSEKGFINFNYIKITNLSLNSNSDSRMYLNNSILLRDKCSYSNYSELTKISNSRLSSMIIDNCDSSLGINSDSITDSEFTNIHLRTQLFINSSITNGEFNINNGSAEYSTFDDLYISARSNTSFKYNTIKKSRIHLDIMDYEDISFNYNNILNLESFGGDSCCGEENDMAYNISHNYWGTTDLEAITKLTNYSPTQEGDSYSRTLYPIISSADIFNADFDNDGIPDYIDSDNDNDRYSDLQEDKESDPKYGSIYNPLDASSHPNSEKDNDFDGIIDSEDDDDDNDGLTDTEEENYQTNSFLKDSDGDGVSDFYEIEWNYDPLDKESSPLSIDNIFQTTLNGVALMWQNDGAEVQKQWLTDENYASEDYFDTSGDTATTYCSELEIDIYDDWRLPTREELEDLYIKREFLSYNSNYYWSSTTHEEYKDYAWGVNFNYGYVGRSNKDNNRYVRCVRGGQ
ncbi:MAG: carboxypeptidase regulatory-like domain-containing protein [Campylobacterota bacterium]|nr:carboxypeptidase regulatory-like domain-containing protein [Campylobacterota bacterium]